MYKHLINANDGSKIEVKRIFCVGKNYLAHVEEMGGQVEADKPVFFMKPISAIPDDNNFTLPDEVERYDYEVELAIVMKSSGFNISKQEALSKVLGYGVALDMTCRSRQKELSKKGSPWEAAKALDNSMPISKIVDIGNFSGNIYDKEISLSVNGEIKQKAKLNTMILNIEEIIFEISKIWKLYAGDVILTGTPSGVGQVFKQDKIVCSVEDLIEFTSSIK